MIEKKPNTNRISAIKKFNTSYVVGNIIVATREQIKYQINGNDCWFAVSTEEDIRRISDIGDIDCYFHDGLTPEGQKMLDEYNANKDKDEEDDD